MFLTGNGFPFFSDGKSVQSPQENSATTSEDGNKSDLRPFQFLIAVYERVWNCKVTRS